MVKRKKERNSLCILLSFFPDVTVEIEKEMKKK
jgi:hypothetical protein